jgi:hypothetical protein
METSNIFEQNPFKKFTIQKFREMSEKNEMQSIFKMRERAIEFRKLTQEEHLN